MKPRERVARAIAHKGVDRVPVMSILAGYAAKLYNVGYGEMALDANTTAMAHINALKRHNFDSVYVSTHYVVCEALGLKAEYLDDRIDQTTLKNGTIINNSDDLIRIKNFDPSEHECTRRLKKAIEIVVNEVGDEYSVRVFDGVGPWSSAAMLRGIEKLMLDIYDNEQFLYDFLDVLTDAGVRFTKFLSEVKPDYYVLGDGTASLLDRDNYKKFVFPFIKKAVKHKQEVGPVFLHYCGNNIHIMDLLAQIGPAVLELDYPVDMKVCKNIMNESSEKDKMPALLGNINPSKLLLLGTYSDVYNESVKLIKEIDGLKGGFILSAGCEVPSETPGSNIDAMVKASMDCSA